MTRATNPFSCRWAALHAHLLLVWASNPSVGVGAGVPPLCLLRGVRKRARHPVMAEALGAGQDLRVCSSRRVKHCAWVVVGCSGMALPRLLMPHRCAKQLMPTLKQNMRKASEEYRLLSVSEFGGYWVCAVGAHAKHSKGHFSF